MTLHYVYVDSRNRNPNEKVNDFQVMLHNPIKNVVKREGGIGVVFQGKQQLERS